MPNAMRSVPPRLGFGSADTRRPGSVAAVPAVAATAVATGAVVGAATGTATVGRTAGNAVGAVVGAAAWGAGAPHAAKNRATVPLAKPRPASRRANSRRVSAPVRSASKTAWVSGSIGMSVLPLHRQDLISRRVADPDTTLRITRQPMHLGAIDAPLLQQLARPRIEPQDVS